MAELKLGTWAERKRYLYVLSLFCACVIAYVLGSGTDTRTGETSIEMAFILLGTLAMTFIAGKVVERIGMARAENERRRRSYRGRVEEGDL